MDVRERWPVGAASLEEMVLSIIDRRQSEMHTAMPVRVVKDSDGHTVSLQPLVKRVQRMPDGTEKIIDYPVISDVPVQFATGGGTTATFPIKEKDEGIAIIASRAFCNWWQQGGEQNQGDARMHDMSDAFYIPGVRSNPRKLKNISTTSAQMRSDDGKHLFDLHPQTGPTMSADEGKHVVSVNPQSGISVKTAMKLAVDASKGMDFKGAAHFKDKVTSDKSFGAPFLSGMLGGVAGFVLALACAAVLMAVHAPQGGVQTAVYTLAALWGY